VKFFFKALRIALGPFLLLWEFITRPKGLVRVPAQQALVDASTRNLVLYQFKTCPFCMKVRQEMARLSLRIEKRDAQYDEANRSALIAAVGKPKVPCLQITHDSGQVEWLLDSKAIMAYLQGRFSS
jgi:glutaredoxin